MRALLDLKVAQQDVEEVEDLTLGRRYALGHHVDHEGFPAAIG